MKITIYELLGMIKDGKAPKKIKFCESIYEWDEDSKFYLTQEKNYKIFLGGNADDINVLFNAFNENVEIIEEDKDIEEITIFEHNNSIQTSKGAWTARNLDKAFAFKINELIRDVNKLKNK